MQREVREELGIAVQPQSIRYLYTVVGPAYGQAGDVELICFAAEWQNEPHPHGEISEAAWIDWRDHEQLAPAVRMLCDQWLRSEPAGLEQ
jgi:8-oxo-dGTP pyrophosphatase MutT (NUDIX family)